MAPLLMCLRRFHCLSCSATHAGQEILCCCSYATGFCEHLVQTIWHKCDSTLCHRSMWNRIVFTRQIRVPIPFGDADPGAFVLLRWQHSYQVNRMSDRLATTPRLITRQQTGESHPRPLRRISGRILSGLLVHRATDAGKSQRSLRFTGKFPLIGHGPCQTPSRVRTVRHSIIWTQSMGFVFALAMGAQRSLHDLRQERNDVACYIISILKKSLSMDGTIQYQRTSRVALSWRDLINVLQGPK
jgi:hypothetical protein